MSDDRDDRWVFTIITVMFAAMILFILEDITRDLFEKEPLSHLVVEFLDLATAIIGLGLAFWRIRGLKSALDAARQDARRWREENRSLVQGLGAAIHTQFDAWGLSEAESDIGLLLLKGLSLQEIADLRATSERTVREQARAVYRKSGLAGRNELSAYFLEDLLPGLPG